MKIAYCRAPARAHTQPMRLSLSHQKLYVPVARSIIWPHTAFVIAGHRHRITRPRRENQSDRATARIVRALRAGVACASPPHARSLRTPQLSASNLRLVGGAREIQAFVPLRGRWALSVARPGGRRYISSAQLSGHSELLQHDATSPQNRKTRQFCISDDPI